MSAARKEKFTNRDIQLSDWSKALAHPARIMILTLLAEKKECICGDLVLDLPLAQSTVSQHLKALKEIGLIKGTIDGPRSRYCIDWKVFNRYQRYISDWSKKINRLKVDNCC